MECECDLLIDGICTDCGKSHTSVNYRFQKDPDTRLRTDKDLEFENKVRNIVD